MSVQFFLHQSLCCSPTNMKRDHNSGDQSGTLSILGDLRVIIGGHLRHFRGPMGTTGDLWGTLGDLLGTLGDLLGTLGDL